MTGAEIITETRFLTKASSSSFSDAQILAGSNVHYGELAIDIARVATDFNFDAEEATATLKSTVGLVEGDNGYNGEYAWPSDIIKPVRMEISYDGSTWYKATIYDINENEHSEHDQDDIQDTFIESEPFVRVERNSFSIRPLKTTSGDITKGIHVWYSKSLADITALTSPAILNKFHNLFPLRQAIRYGLRNPESMNANWKVMYDELHTKFSEYYKNQIKRTIVMRPNYENMK